MATRDGPPPTTRPSGPAGLVIWARERLNAAVLPVAMLAGGAGMVALLACASLVALPAERRPLEAPDDRVATWGMLALCAASLLGWGCMQLGMRRLRAAVGWRVGGWLFVLGPLVCATAGLVVGKTDLVDPAALPHHELWWPVVRFYPPSIVALCIVVYVLGRGRRQDGGTRRWLERGWALLLVAPYALLIGVLAFGLPLPWLSDGLKDTLGELGAWALVLQIILAFFVGGGSV